MYNAGITNTNELNRFFSLQTIQELDLSVPTNLFDDGIDEDDFWKDNEPELEAPTFVPFYFSSMLFPPFNDVTKSSRPITHELVSPLDEVMPSTGSRNVGGVAWPPQVTIVGDSFARNINSKSTPLEDEEDNWVDFAAVQRQRKLEASLDPVEDDDLETLKWGLLGDPLIDGKNRSMGLKPVRIPRPLWFHGSRMAARV